jgi:uncharacterized membrane protein
VNRQQGIQWLYGELPALLSEGVLSTEMATRLQQYYGTVQGRSRRALVLLVCSIFGAILIGLGVILLFAHNWQDLSRPVRTVLAFLPLLAGQCLTGWAMQYRTASAAWREGAAMFLCLAIGASIALVGQTYHFSGNMTNFLLVWIVLGLPLVYLVPASLPAALAWIGLTFWVGYAQKPWGQGALFWPLAAVPVPYLWMGLRHNPYGQRSVLLSWVLALCLSIAIGLRLAHHLPGLWIVVYTGLFAVFYLLDAYVCDPVPAFWQRPWHTIGVVGLAGLSIFLTYDTPWGRIGWHYDRTGWQDLAWVAVQDYGLAIGLLALTLGLLVPLSRRQQTGRALFGVAPCVAALAYVAVASGASADVARLVFNVYFLLLGIGTTYSGIRHGRLGTMNGGLLLVSALIMARFLDVELSFTARGIVFVGLGAAFLGTNLAMRRRGIVS